MTDKRKHDIIVLLDFDGVIADTEYMYTRFWNDAGMKYLGIKDLGIKAKGQTLKHISELFTSQDDLKMAVRDLDRFESEMPYDLIPGVSDFLRRLKEDGIPTAIVTSSNNKKMENVWRVHPDLKGLVTTVLTSEHFSKSKPDPECFITAMKKLGGGPEHSIVFEDSLHGIQAGRNSGAFVVGLSTTFPQEQLSQICDMVIPDFTGITLDSLRSGLGIH